MRRRKQLFRLIVGILFLSMTAPALAGNQGGQLEDPVQTAEGLVSGTVIDTKRIMGSTPFVESYDAVIGELGEQVRVYRGIPYAAPPVGDLRWKAPQPVTPWEGIRESTEFSPLAPQPFPTSFIFGSVGEDGMSEDCLYLNVLTPAKRSNERLPVIVWFHGGGLTIGSSNSETINTGFLPQHGAVLVTVQHRIGAMGYFAHPALSSEDPNGASGYYGQLDLVASLEWVQRNIAAFGGDPDNVTIIGQSGGGQKVYWLMASPLGQGLFHRAISQSGGIGGTPQAITESLGLSLAEGLGVVGTGPDALEDLRALSWQEIIAKADSGDTSFRALHTVDGWSLLDSGPAVLGSGLHNDVPLMIGYAGGEMGPIKSPFTLGLVPAIQQESDIFVYLFTHVPANWADEGAFAWHGSDVAYEYGTQGIVERALGVFLPPTLNPDPGIDERDDFVANYMAETLVRFAESGDPNRGRRGPGPKKGDVVWPTYDVDEGDLYLDIGFPPVVGEGFSILQDQQPPR